MHSGARNHSYGRFYRGTSSIRARAVAAPCGRAVAGAAPVERPAEQPSTATEDAGAPLAKNAASTAAPSNYCRGASTQRTDSGPPRQGAISASRCVEAPSRHRRDSCPSDEVVRTASSDRDAPRRTEAADAAAKLFRAAPASVLTPHRWHKRYGSTAEKGDAFGSQPTGQNLCSLRAGARMAAVARMPG